MPLRLFRELTNRRVLAWLGPFLMISCVQKTYKSVRPILTSVLQRPTLKLLLVCALSTSSHGIHLKQGAPVLRVRCFS